MIHSTQRLARENNRIIVRVWTSLLDTTIKGRNKGHVSIEIENCKTYISLWYRKYEPTPDDEGSNYPLTQRLFGKIPADFTTNLGEDILRTKEKRLPEITICFYSLDTQKIIDKFNSLRNATSNWTLIRPNFISFRSDDSHSCASLAYSLLIAGGIKKLLNEGRMTYPSRSSVDTVEDIVEIIINAKRVEFESFPFTKGFIFNPVRGTADMEEGNELYEKEFDLKENPNEISAFLKSNYCLFRNLLFNSALLGIIPILIYYVFFSGVSERTIPSTQMAP